MSEFIVRVKENLPRLKKLDPSCNFFGSAVHLYELNPVVSEKEILEFEKSNSCTLPEKYREFLTLAGNGGAGPSYGIHPLGMDYDGRWPDFIKPGHPFPFTDAHNDTSMLTKGQPDKSSFASVQEYEKACDEWWDKYREELFISYCEVHLLNGAIPIVDHGCALSSWLVVAEGPEYGYIWEDHIADEEGVFPLKNKNSERYTFDQWYLEWIENSITELNQKAK